MARQDNKVNMLPQKRPHFRGRIRRTPEEEYQRRLKTNLTKVPRKMRDATDGLYGLSLLIYPIIPRHKP